MRLSQIIFALVALLLLTACTSKQAFVQQSKTTHQGINPVTERPKNVILMIADGTGLSQISALQFYKQDRIHYERFEHIGLIKTSSSAELITDSAAGATAFAAGVKTYNGAIGVDMDTIAVPTLIEQLQKKDYATGVIATSTITHATPASFYAHVDYRKKEEEIATYLVDSNIDFFAGGGLDFFINREDKKDYLQLLTEKGYLIGTDTLYPKQWMDGNKKYGYLLAPGGMPRMIDGRGDFLPNATRLGINRLSKNSDGFFLMVEGSQIDWGGHDNDAPYLIGEIKDFDNALGVALDFAQKDGNTLVVVTADHETGGFTLASQDGDYNVISPSFSTGGHSGTMVPVFAYGPGAEAFRGIYENTAIYTKLKKLLRL